MANTNSHPSSADAKRALLKQLLARRIAASEFPLSHAQRALWLFHLLAPGMATYNVGIPVIASPQLDCDRLSRAVNAVIARHPALRTTLSAPEGVPLQRSSEALTRDIAVVDVSGIDGDRLAGLVLEDHGRPFDLETSPLRVTVFREADRDVLLIAVHHIVFDAVSCQVLFEELRTVYEALERQERPALPPLTGSYRDFVQAQSEWLSSARGADAWEYWRNRLSSAPPALVLPDRQRAALQRYSGASAPLAIDAETYAALGRLAREQRGTLVAVLLAAYSALLRTLSGQKEVVVGMPVSGRNRPEWSGIIGYFVNMLPLRLALPGDLPFREHVSRTAEELRNALAHQDFPFPLIVERLKVPRVAGQSPVFQTVLNVRSTRGMTDFARMFDPENEDTVRFGSSALRPFPLRQQEGQFDLSMELVDVGDRLVGCLKYNSDWLSAGDAAHVAGSFAQLLSYVASNPESPLSAYPVGPLPAAIADEECDRIEI